MEPPRHPIRVQHIAVLSCLVLAGATPSVAPAQCPDGQWTLRLPPLAPAARSGHAMAYDAGRARVLLFGGEAGATRFGDTWEWDGAAWTMRVPAGAAPISRHGPAMAYDSDRHVTVLFGGMGSSLMSDTWEWDGAQGTWTIRVPTPPSSTPAPRRYAAMAYDAARHVTVLFGGGVGIGLPLGDTWEWSGAAGTWTQRSPDIVPPPREQHVMAYDTARSRIILWGGSTNDSRVWEWNGGALPAGAWVERAASETPLGRTGAAVAYDAARNRCVLFGGMAPNYANDTWEWNAAGGWGGVWSIRSLPAAPPPRARAAMVYDAAHGRSVLFGGLSPSGPRADTWELPSGPLPGFTQHPSPRTVAVGQPATFTVSATGASPVQYRWRRNGVPLSDSSSLSGANTSMLTIFTVTQADEGAYDAVAADTCGSALCNAATLTVTTGPPPCRADYDGSGAVEPADVALFISTWFTSLLQGTTAGDFDASGTVEPGDVAAFINSWFVALTSGC